MTLITALEIALIAAGVVAVVGVLHAIGGAHAERVALRTAGVNGTKRLLVLSHLVRAGCRLWAALWVLVGGTHLVLLPNGAPTAALVAKIGFLNCALALVGTVLVDVYVRKCLTEPPRG